MIFLVVLEHFMMAMLAVKVKKIGSIWNCAT
jgi:hypothetical protein